MKIRSFIVAVSSMGRVMRANRTSSSASKMRLLMRLSERGSLQTSESCTLQPIPVFCGSSLKSEEIRTSENGSQTVSQSYASDTSHQDTLIRIYYCMQHQVMNLASFGSYHGGLFARYFSQVDPALWDGTVKWS